MRSRSCFSGHRLTRCTVSRREVLVWTLIFAASLVSGAYVIRQFVAQASESGAVDVDAQDSPALVLPFSQIWGLFSLERKVLLAGLITASLECVASTIAVRRKQRTTKFGHTSSHPTQRRFWYDANKAAPPRAITVPCIVAATYLVVFVMVRMVLFTMLHPAATEAFFTDTDSAGISLSWMLQLVNLALIAYLAASILYSLLPTSAGRWQERFILVFAVTVLVTTRYTVY